MKKALLCISVALNMILIAFCGIYVRWRICTYRHVRAVTASSEKARSYADVGLKCVYESSCQVLFLQDMRESPLTFCYHCITGKDAITAVSMPNHKDGDNDNYLAWTPKMKVSMRKDQDNGVCLLYNGKNGISVSNDVVIIRSPGIFPLRFVEKESETFM